MYNNCYAFWPLWQVPWCSTYPSNTQRDLLKEKLDQLQCHFTWGLQKEAIQSNDMKYRLQDSLKLDVKYKAASYNQLAFVNCIQGNCEEAIQNLKEAERILRENHKDEFERRSIITYGNFAWVHYHMGNLTEAQSYLDKLEMICKPLSDGPRCTAMIPEVYGEKGWSLITSSNSLYYEEAKESFEKALKEDPNNTEWIMGYATVLFRLESIFRPANHQSIRHLRRVLQLDSDDTVAMVLLALKLQILNQKKEATALVEEALQKTPDFPYMLRYAAKFWRLEEDVEKAIGLLKKALEIIPDSIFLHHQIALCYEIKLKQLIHNLFPQNGSNCEDQQKTDLIRKCKHHFAKVGEQRPSAVKPQLDFAHFCVRIEEYSKAEEIYDKLLKLVNISPREMQEICLKAGLFQKRWMNSESSAITLFLKGLKTEHESNNRQKCRLLLEQLLNRKLERNPQDNEALHVKSLLNEMDENSCNANGD
ncbi:interferon-induced protein with tetratricopeptide repeats 1-like [Hemitrygon akajei]|uniref:interferon-induced protein with tetratricopeptide repeats 1-like n=1 Tax=Hemitrygon akajei TaxID=2704970 RepID=UPI003BF97CC0